MNKRDETLSKFVHEEIYKDLRIWASISSFGDLFVAVRNTDLECIASFSNILEARRFIDNCSVQTQAA